MSEVYYEAIKAVCAQPSGKVRIAVRKTARRRKAEVLDAIEMVVDTVEVEEPVEVEAELSETEAPVDAVEIPVAEVAEEPEAEVAEDAAETTEENAGKDGVLFATMKLGVRKI